MSDKIRGEITSLNARVTALTMLVEALWAENLADEDDPAAIGDTIINGVFQTDAKMRDAHGESAFALEISEALTSVIERAVMRALSQKSKRPRH